VNGLSCGRFPLILRYGWMRCCHAMP
jgi:hypothetical protein